MTTSLVLQQGIASGYAWQIVDGDGQPADLTGWTVASQVRRSEDPGSALLHEFTASIVGSSVTIQWTAAESLLWTFTSGSYDVVLIDPDGVPRQVIAQGLVSVDRVVTHG